MSVDELNCNYCESVLSANDDACKNCGAARTVASNTYSQKLLDSFDNVIDNLGQSQRNLRLTKLHLAVSCLALAGIFGILGSKFHNGAPDDRPQQSLVEFTGKELPSQYEVSDAQYNEFRTQAEFVSVMADVAWLRFAMHMHYSENGEWPESFKDMDINTRSLNLGKNIKSIKLGDNGQLLVELNENFSSNSRIKLHATAIMMGNSVEWYCTTNINFSQRKYTNCEYDPAVEIAQLD